MYRGVPTYTDSSRSGGIYQQIIYAGCYISRGKQGLVHNQRWLSLWMQRRHFIVKWEYLFVILGWFGIGSSYIKWVKLLYECTMASVLTNGNISTPFKLLRWTRQGCPLSPLIFALTLEPLISAIRGHINIKGIVSGQKEPKLLLYVDNIFL